MWELDHKESWVLKNWCLWTVVSEKTLKSPLDCKGIQPVHHKGNQSWIFIGRTDAEAEAPILWSPDAKNWLMWKDPDAGKDWRQEEEGMVEDEMVGWHHQLMDMNLSRFQKLVMDREAWCATVHGIAKSWTWLSDWTELKDKWWNYLQRTLHTRSIQSCPTLCDPVDCSLPGSSIHGLFQARTPGVGGHFLLQGIFPTQGSNLHLLCLLHWQVDSLPLRPLGSPYGKTGLKQSY